MKTKLEPYLYLAPGFLLLGVFIILPIAILFLISFFNWNMFTGAIDFAGLTNYTRFASDSSLHRSLGNTLFYVLGSVPLSMAAALFLAVMLERKIRYVSIFRTAVFLPVIVSLAASGIIWLWIYDYNNGILNHLIGMFGIQKIDWLGNPGTAMPSVIAVTLWKRIGYNMVIFFAGLQVIPRQLYEAAGVDGAYAWNQFRYITWPNLLPTTSFVLVINLIFAFRDFAQIYIMTRGGPLGSTTTLVYYIYETAFEEFNIGYAAALSMLLFSAVLLITYIKMKYLTPEENEA